MFCTGNSTCITLLRIYKMECMIGLDYNSNKVCTYYSFVKCLRQKLNTTFFHAVFEITNFMDIKKKKTTAAARPSGNVCFNA